MTTTNPKSDIDASVTHTLPTPKQALSIAARGFAMGVAEVIPGVSGSTIALILGIYRRFIDAIKSYTPQSVLAFILALPRFRSDPATLSSAAALASSARARPPTARRMKVISARWLSRSAVKIRNCMAQPRKKR